jgi:HEAT repeat protein
LAAATATVLFLGVVVVARSLAGLIARRDRRLVRERIAILSSVWRDYALHGGSPGTVRRLARAADETVFWGALETLAPELDRRALRYLAQAIRGFGHHRRECRALRDDSPWRRELAARRLAFVPSRLSRRALRDALEQGPEFVAYAAARALARQRDRETLVWILEHPSYFASRPPRARTALLHAFGPGATLLLAERLRAGIDDPALERSVIERLGAAGHRPAAPAIRQRLEHPVTEVRVAAARALGRLADDESAPALVQALADAAWEVRAQAARALGQLGHVAAIPTLAARLGDPVWWVRRHAAYALAQMGPAGRAALGSEARGARDRFAREIASEALDVRVGARPRAR